MLLCYSTYGWLTGRAKGVLGLTIRVGGRAAGVALVRYGPRSVAAEGNRPQCGEKNRNSNSRNHGGSELASQDTVM